MNPLPSDSKNSGKRRALYQQQKGLCRYCDNPLPSPHHGVLDHVKPASKGGKNGRRNRALACKACDDLKMNMASLEEALVFAHNVVDFFVMLRKKNIC